MEHFLRQIVHDNSQPVEIPLTRSDIVVGRVIQDLANFRQVSRRHANLRRANGKWFISDLRSINGVFVNQLKISREEELQIGDHIGFGVDNPSLGFVCALSVRPLVKIKTEVIEVIDISDEDQPLVKLEPPSNDQDDHSCVPPPVASHSVHPNLPTNPVKFSMVQESVKSNDQQLVSEDFSFSHNNQTLISDLHSSNSRVNPHNQNMYLQQPNTSSSLQFSVCSDSNVLSSKVPAPENLLKEIEEEHMHSRRNLPSFNLVSLNPSSAIPSSSNVSQPHPLKFQQFSSSHDGTFSSKITSPDPKKNEEEPVQQKSNLSNGNLTPFSSTSAIPSTQNISQPNLSKYPQCSSSETLPSKITSHDLKKIEGKQVLEESNFSNGNLTPSNITSAISSALYVSRFSEKHDSKVISFNKLKGVENKKILCDSNLPCMNVISPKLTTAIPSTSSGFTPSSVLKSGILNITEDIPPENKRSDPFKVSSKSTSSVQSTDKCSQEQNRHLVETSFGSLYSAASYLPQFQANKSMANQRNNLLDDHKELNVIKDCYVKLRRCDEEEEEESEDMQFNSKRKRIKIISDSDSDAESATNVNSLPRKMKIISDAGSDTNVNSSSRKMKILSESDSEAENTTYSQADEVIIIDSDDEEYYDFNPSQLVVKTEPIDEEEPPEGNFEDVAIDSTDYSKLSHSYQDKKLMNLNKPSNLPNPSECSNSATPSYIFHSRLSFDEDVDLSNDEQYETVDDVRKFLEDNPPRINESDSSKSSHDEIIIPSKLKPKLKPPVKKSTGRTMWTDPKPMERRPRSKRGREEWFEEKTDDSSTSRNTVKQSRKDSKAKKSPKKHSTANLKNFKIPKKTRSDGPKTPERVRSSVLSAVEAPNEQSFVKAGGGTGIIKKKAPVIARKPGKPSRSEILASEVQIPPKRSALKPHVSPPKKSAQVSSSDSFPGRSFKTVSETLLNKTIDDKMKHSYNRNNTIEINHTGNNKGNRRVHFANNLESETGPRISGDSKAARPLNANHNRPLNLYQPRNGDPQLSRDPRINRDNFAQVYPATDQFIPDTTNVRDHNVAQATNSLLSKYPSSSSKPINSSKTESAVSSYYYRTILIKKIVKLNTKWLEEYNKKVESLRQRGKNVKVAPPPDVMENASVVPLSFSSLEEYVTTFTPLVMLEIWESMCESWRENNNTRKFYFVISSSTQKQGLREYVCRSIVNDMSFCPVRGSIVVLNLRTDNKVQPVFGYIHDHRIEKLGSSFIPCEPWNRCEPRWIQNAKWFVFNVNVKDRFQDSKDFPVFSPNLLLKGSGLYNIGTKISLMDNFYHLSKSPLCYYILSPTDKGFFLAPADVSPGGEYNHEQTLAINSICKEMTIREPKIMLLQGPPGTGKSHTLIGLLEKMVFCRNLNVKKILVVAPSNAAVDEIGQRLIQLNKRSHRGIVRFVRIGVPNQISKALLPYTLDSKVKEILDKEAQSKEEEIKKCRKQIEELQKKKNYDSDTHIKELEKKITSINNHLSSGFKNRHAHKKQVLQNCNIILSTLGSCSQHIMTSTFRPDSCLVSCVIVDEAAQCTELELLQTMAFRSKKLILIGDHQQLEATVLSDHAKDFRLERSMFERVSTCLTEKYRGVLPSRMLREQFRMHSEICKFPSRYFYHNKLFTSPSVVLRDEKLFQNYFKKPYVVFDILESHENRNLSSSKTNSTEALVVINLCEQLLALKLSLSIGIITPYQGQCSLYTEAFKGNPDYSHHIEVNTVDGFQGQEKDVIILSCVRANRTGGIGFLACPKRLNVAITRARRILIICGCLSTLKQSPDWSALIDDARERKLVHLVTSAKEIPHLFQTIIRR